MGPPRRVRRRGRVLGHPVSSARFRCCARQAIPRAAAGDPRPSIAERYPSRAHYLGLIAQQATELADAGYVLDEYASAMDRWFPRNALLGALIAVGLVSIGPGPATAQRRIVVQPEAS